MNATKVNNIQIEFEDNDILALLSGEHNQHLAHIEKSLNVTLDSFGNSIKISGAAKATKTARIVIENLHKRILETCRDAGWDGIDQSIVDDAVRWAINGHHAEAVPGANFFETWKKKIVAKTKGQNDYLRLLRDHEVVFGAWACRNRQNLYGRCARSRSSEKAQGGTYNPVAASC